MPVPKTEQDTLAIFPFASFLRPHNPPLTDICQSPLVCVSVNVEWTKFIVGALDALDQYDLWIGTDEEKEDARQKVRSIISMFSYPCADEAAEIRRYYNDWRQYQTTLLTLYDGTPESIDQDAPDTNFDSDSGDVGTDASIRYLALCAAVRAWVDTSCAQWIIQKQQFTAGLSLIVTLLAGALPFGGFIIGLLVTAALNWIANIDISALQDEEAKQEMACCLLENLVGVEISEENWCESWPPCEAALSGNAAIIAEGFNRSDVCQRGNYVAFLKNLAEQYRYGKAGLLENCGCGCNYVFTFDEATGYTVIDGHRELLTGSDYIIEGDGFLVSGQLKGHRAEVSLPLDAPCPVSKVRVVYRFNHGSANTICGFNIILKLGGVEVASFPETISNPKNVWTGHDFIVYGECDEVIVEIGVQNTIFNVDDEKYVNLNTITINP